jgi:hypothetical protein
MRPPVVDKSFPIGLILERRENAHRLGFLAFFLVGGFLPAADTRH